MYFMATSCLVSLCLKSLATPKLPAPKSLTTSYLSIFASTRRIGLKKKKKSEESDGLVCYYRVIISRLVLFPDPNPHLKNINTWHGMAWHVLENLSREVKVIHIKERRGWIWWVCTWRRIRKYGIIMQLVTDIMAIHHHSSMPSSIFITIIIIFFFFFKKIDINCINKNDNNVCSVMHYVILVGSPKTALY